MNDLRSSLSIESYSYGNYNLHYMQIYPEIQGKVERSAPRSPWCLRPWDSSKVRSNKITDLHLSRKAIVYLRQSSDQQVRTNTESQRLQYALVDRARALGFERVEVIDTDLGSSASIGARQREGFQSLIASIALGEVGLVLSREVSLAGSCFDCYRPGTFATVRAGRSKTRTRASGKPSA